MVERAQTLLCRRQRVKAMQVVDIDVVRRHSPQTRFARLDQMMARRPQIVGTRPHAKRCLRGDQNLFAASGDRLPENRLGKPV